MGASGASGGLLSRIAGGRKPTSAPLPGARTVRGAFHLAPELDRLIALVGYHVVPAHRHSRFHRAPQLEVMRETDGQAPQAQTVGGRHQLAPDGEAAFAVQHLAFLQVALGGGDDVAAKSRRRAGRLVSVAVPRIQESA